MSIEAQRAALSEYDFYIVIDRSGSMGAPVKAGTQRTRWQAVEETASQIAREVSAIDTDGITVTVFGGESIQSYENADAAKVALIFGENRPSGGTPLAEALQQVFKLSEVSNKKDLIIVFTDGVPDDAAAVNKAIVGKTLKMQADDECTILFVQVGDDAAATKYLQMLDDNLKGAKFDIVDTKTQAEAEKMSVEDLLLNAIVD